MSAAPAPRLAVVVVVDQLRGDEIAEYGSLWRYGFQQLRRSGRWYTRAMHGHARTETAAGHASIATGVNPRHHGVVDKAIYDPQRLGVFGVCDFGEGDCDADILSAPTLGDRLKTKHPGAKVVSLAQKDYSAMLLGGQLADLVAWTEAGDSTALSGRSSAGEGLPSWLRMYFEQVAGVDRIARIWELPRLPIPFRNRKDDGEGELDCGHGTTFPHRVPNDIGPQELYWAWRCSPDSDRAMVDVALHVTRHMDLGRDETPDLLLLSLSAVDVVGHAYGYESLERVAVLMELDRLLGDLLQGLVQIVGNDGLLFALTSDHGVAPRVATARARGHESGRIETERLAGVARTAIAERLGLASPRVVVAFPFLHVLGLEGERRVAAIEAAVAALAKLPEIYGAWPTENLANATEPVAKLMYESSFPGRSGDIAIALKPWFAVKTRYRLELGAEHGTPWDYDRHVPVLLWGRNVKSGRIDESVRVIDLTRELSDRLGLAAAPNGGSPLP